MTKQTDQTTVQQTGSPLSAPFSFYWRNLMFDSKQLFTGILATATVGMASGATISSVGTTGVFDEGTTTNAIDTDPTGQLAAFTSAVATAYANDLGGVIDWETGVTTTASNGAAPNNTITGGANVSVAYGVSATESLNITFSRGMELYTNNIAGQVNVISSEPNRDNALITDTTSPTDSFIVTFSGADVAQVGMAMLSRSTFDATNGVDFRATATFSDASTTVIDYNLTNVIAADDTFLHFEAGSGLTISSVKVEVINKYGANDFQARPILDDLGFVLVPEPSSLALLGLGGLLVARRRR